MLILTTYVSGSIIAEGGTLEPVDHTALYDVIVESASQHDLLVITHVKAPVIAWLEWAFDVVIGRAITYTDDLIHQSAAILIDVHPAVANLNDIASLAQAHKSGLIHFYWVATEEMASTEAVRTDVLVDPEYTGNAETDWQYAPHLFA